MEQLQKDRETEAAAKLLRLAWTAELGDVITALAAAVDEGLEPEDIAAALALLAVHVIADAGGDLGRVDALLAAAE